jgi:hypothetical protein
MAGLALCLPLLVVSCEGLAGPDKPDPPPREVETMPARHAANRAEPATATRCRIYFGCVAATTR